MRLSRFATISQSSKIKTRSKDCALILLGFLHLRGKIGHLNQKIIKQPSNNLMGASGCD
jgi:hypothetical protein